MIFVTLGTQDKSFSRLLVSIEEQIKKGNIQDKVVVQAGNTKFESKVMEIHSLLSMDEFEDYIKKCDILITHGGVGSIMSGIKNNKKVIAAARLSKFGEHTNDHQKQIISEFVKKGYILELSDFNKLDDLLIKAKEFHQKNFISNNQKMLDLICDSINNFL